jgi:hypothetical protein
MVNKTMRDLTGHSIAVAVTPNSINPGSSIYPMIASQNRIIDTTYSGQDNILGNVPVEVFNNPQSGYLYACDIARIKLGMHYNYLALTSTDLNWAYNNEAAKAMAEAISNAFAETFTDLPFFNYHITTSMPGNASGMKYLAFATFYQSVLQNICMVINSYNTILALEDTLMQQAWLREVPQLTELYGLLKKAAFKSLMTGISNYIPGSALDVAWLTQMNILTNIPCKRSDSYLDPLICVMPYTKIPNTKVTIGDSSPTTVFEYSNTGNSDYNVTVQGVNYHLGELFAAITEAMSPYAIQMWARKRFENTSTVDARTYFNDLTKMLEGLMAALARFPADTADFDVVLKVLQRAGLNNWRYGTTPIVGTPKYKPAFNKLLYDVIKARSCGGSNMIFDDSTRRWKFYTLWDSVVDIPDYDMKNGGSFLTFALRTVPTASSNTEYYTTKYMIPKLFELADAPIKIANRKGQEFTLGFGTYNYSQLRNSAVFARLAPLDSMGDAVLRVPTITVSGSGGVAKSQAAFCEKMVMRMMGVGNVVENNVTHSILASEIECLVDEQLEDISNAMINHARVTSPFRVAVDRNVKIIGFAGGA